MIIVFAAPDDVLSADVREESAKNGRECLLIPPPGPSCAFGLRWELPAPAPAHVEFEGRRLNIEEISAIIVRALPEPPRDIRAESDGDYLRLEWFAALLGWLRAVPARVVNRPRPGRNLCFPDLYAHAAQFRAAGLNLARVLATDSDAEARRFFRTCGRGALLVQGCQDPPRLLEGEGELPGGICCLIDVPEGVRRRIHVVGDEVFAESVPDDGGKSPAGASLPERLVERCLAATRLLGLQFLELVVVSGKDGDVAIGAADLPDAVFADAGHGRRVAGALSRMSAGRLGEARP